MYANKQTVELAVSKGYKHCTCTDGGYPGCLCGKGVYSPIRLDDIQRWIRNKHNYHIEVMLEDDTPYTSFYYRVMKLRQYFTQSHHGLVSLSYDDVLEAAITETLLELI